jgi:hypothetical protein
LSVATYESFCPLLCWRRISFYSAFWRLCATCCDGLQLLNPILFWFCLHMDRLSDFLDRLDIARWTGWMRMQAGTNMETQLAKNTNMTGRTKYLRAFDTITAHNMCIHNV